MKKKATLTILLMLTSFVSLYGLSRVRVDEHQKDYKYRLRGASSPLPNAAVEAIAGEFKGMVANYLLLEAASFIGSQDSSDADDADWEAVARLLDQSSHLDPYFKQTYRLAQSTLPWQAKKYDQTFTILKRSKKHLPWDWQPGFFIGFNYFYFLKDNLTASNELMEASKISNAPMTLATLASRLASRAGQTSAAIDFLNAIYESSNDQQTKEELRIRIVALKGILILQSAVAQFQTQFGRPPQTLNEMVDTDILPELPINPYDRPFSYNNGEIDF